MANTTVTDFNNPDYETLPDQEKRLQKVIM